jgi:HD-GYP domain-containing protein (c-di-GMP phosphodiesterase class II)
MVDRGPPGRLPPGREPMHASSHPASLLRLARDYDRGGRLDDAALAYEAVIALAEQTQDQPLLAEALRRLAVVRHRRGSLPGARILGEGSLGVAVASGSPTLIAEALNTLGGLELVADRYEQARSLFLRATEHAREPGELLGRVEQNLGSVESLLGNREHAQDHYRRSLQAFLAAGDEHGCAIAYHNLGMISSDLRQWTQAEEYFAASLRAVQRTGDLHLRGLALLNRAEVLLALGRLAQARLSADAAAGIFDELHAPPELADAHRVLGIVSRESGDLPQARTRLRFAVEVAGSSGSPWGEAEAMRELAVVCALSGRRSEALELAIAAGRVFGGLGRPLRPAEILAGDYPPVVRGWGEFLRACRPATFAHSQRVAAAAARVGRELGLDLTGQACALLGGFLHEIGTLADEGDGAPYPARGARLLEESCLPATVLRVVRCHQQTDECSPQGGAGGEAPIEAQIVGLADYYDALLAPAGSDRPMTPEEAVQAVERVRSRWQPRVLEAFHRSRAA